ncbi:hypothetical protein Sgleb_07970 [Streptomyces glebosus]|uniref:Uncharacterized protein n=1 Tax=Streptomyces glebosus TaxID=249580 RepID=A0A640SP35_9ACTN|nr:hypothetical protein Sgleb_07970 [Streptomyces glebosus]
MTAKSPYPACPNGETLRGTDLDMSERSYNRCGKCLLGVRRLSRMKLATSSPERQREDA